MPAFFLWKFYWMRWRFSNYLDKIGKWDSIGCGVLKTKTMDVCVNCLIHNSFTFWEASTAGISA